MAGTIVCKVCQQELAFNSLKIHMEGHFQVEDKKFSCNICDKMFTLKGQLQSHLRMHDDQKGIFCKLCPKSSKWSISKYHKLSHTTTEQVPCDLCPKTFSHPTQLKLHIRNVHHREKSFNCPHCTKTFLSANSVPSHISACHKENAKALSPSYKCDMCHTGCLF